uniref:Uncharacterized protein n=1 Tax=Opuntia streptacantha TaxID=393608 RepID=A0A7C9EAY8_OPUST
MAISWSTSFMHIRHLPLLLLLLYPSAEPLRVAESDVFPLYLPTVSSPAEVDKLLPACLAVSGVMLFTGEPMKLSADAFRSWLWGNREVRNGALFHPNIRSVVHTRVMRMKEIFVILSPQKPAFILLSLGVAQDEPQYIKDWQTIWCKHKESKALFWVYQKQIITSKLPTKASQIQQKISVPESEEGEKMKPETFQRKLWTISNRLKQKMTEEGERKGRRNLEPSLNNPKV